MQLRQHLSRTDQIIGRNIRICPDVALIAFQIFEDRPINSGGLSWSGLLFFYIGIADYRWDNTGSQIESPVI